MPQPSARTDRPQLTERELRDFLLWVYNHPTYAASIAKWRASLPADLRDTSDTDSSTDQE